MTEFTVFTQDDLNPAHDDIEIGKASALHIGSMVMPYMTSYGIIDGQQWWQVQYAVATTDIKVRLREWKTPIPAFPVPVLAPPFRVSADIALASLVRMMGGAVTISSSDLEASERAILESHEELNPRRLVIRVEDR